MAIIGEGIKQTRAVTKVIQEQTTALAHHVPDVQFVGTIPVPYGAPLPVTFVAPFVMPQFQGGLVQYGHGNYKVPFIVFKGHTYAMWFWDGGDALGQGWSIEQLDPRESPFDLMADPYASLELTAMQEIMDAGEWEKAKTVQLLWDGHFHDWAYYCTTDFVWKQGYDIE